MFSELLFPWMNPIPMIMRWAGWRVRMTPLAPILTLMAPFQILFPLYETFQMMKVRLLI